jgi:hypothetical protein
MADQRARLVGLGRLCFGRPALNEGDSVKRFLAAILIAAALPALAQQAAAPVQDADQAVLMRGLLESLRANTEAQQKNTTALDTLTNRVERLEAATRSVPPTIEGARTDFIAIRAGIERLAAGQGARRPAATLRFGPFACGNETEASCAANACKSVGYAGGIGISVLRTGTGAAAKASAVAEATCYD